MTIHYVYLPSPSRCCCARRMRTPYPGLSVMVSLYAVFAFVYVVGLVRCLPRSPGHDALLGIGLGLLVAAWRLWGLVERVPRIGEVIYCLPALALALSPFALDFYLMFVR